jgi:hypothetical protein
VVGKTKSPLFYKKYVWHIPQVSLKYGLDPLVAVQQLEDDPPPPSSIALIGEQLRRGTTKKEEVDRPL